MKKFKVYQITHFIDEENTKIYIGLTERNLQDRLRAHFNEMVRKCNTQGKMNIYSLQYAMRQEYEKNKNDWNKIKFSKFHIELIGCFATQEEMRLCELKLIDEKKALAPYGYNLMRGGHSIGGLGNAKEVTFYFTDKNGKSSHQKFATQKEMYEKFAAEYEIPSSTLRSRVTELMKESKKYNIADALYEAIFEFRDKRETGGTNQTRQRKTRKGRKESLGIEKEFSGLILYPDKNNHLNLSAKKFAELHGVPSSTIRNRTMNFFRRNYTNKNIQKCNAEELNKFIANNKNEFINYLLENHENKLHIVFTYGNKEYKGSLNYLAKELATENLKISAIKRRYRKRYRERYGEKCKLHERDLTNDDYLWVFGLKEKDKDIIIDVPSISQKKRMIEYRIDENLVFPRLVDFANAVFNIVKKSATKNSNKKKDFIQKQISSFTAQMLEKKQSIDYILSKLEIYYGITNLRDGLVKQEQ